MPVFKYILGVDEAGRGPLAGPVSVGGFLAVNEKGFQFDETGEEGLKFEFLDGIKDSKKLTVKKRKEWHEKLTAYSSEFCYCFAFVNNEFIDKKGMTLSLKTGVEKIVRNFEKSVGINPENCFIVLDGMLTAPVEYKQKSIFKGDEKIPLISAASVIAKVSRDKQMLCWHEKYPQYYFAQHKGYGTKLHYEMIKKYGFCKIHRRSFCGDLDVWDKL